MTDVPRPPNPPIQSGSSNKHTQTLVLALVEMFVRGQGRHRNNDLKQFEVLMMHFLKQIDTFTRAVVSQKLAPFDNLPLSILHQLALDEEDVAEPIILSAPQLPQAIVEAILRSGSASLRACLEQRVQRPAAATKEPAMQHATPILTVIETEQAAIATKTEPLSANQSADSLAPQTHNFKARADNFFDTSPEERQAFLIELTEYGEGQAPHPISAPILQNIMRLLALRQIDGVAEILGDTLNLPPAFARKIIDDPHGEALVVIGRVLGFEEDQFMRLALMCNAQVSHNINRVYGLRALYRRVSPQASLRLVDIWRGMKGLSRRFTPADRSRSVGRRPEIFGGRTAPRPLPYERDLKAQ